jgi:saccharopepsin
MVQPASPANLRLLLTVMLLPAIAPLLLLPYAVAAGVHKLKLKKLDTRPINPSLESLYLAEKYGLRSPTQMPLLGSGGQGRRLDSSPVRDDLYWTQEEIINGGHNVPLTSSLPFSLPAFPN